MATKLELYSTLARRQAEQVTQGRGNWTRFLDTAARLYKYPFAEQLMIYAQRPDATACATIETWNEPMRRWVRRGSMGIALIDESGSRPRLKYVFDVSDTEPARENARKPYLWEMREEHEAPVLEALSKTYDDVEGNLADALFNIASQLATEYYNDNDREIGYSAEGSFLEEYDEFNLGVAFRNALTVSVAYGLMSRCGLDADGYFEDEDFLPIFDFNTPAAVYALGTAASDLSEQVLRDIEVTVKRYERQHAAERSAEYERTDIQPRGGLSDSRLEAERTARGTGGADRQIRHDAPEVSERTQDNIVQFPASGREIVSPPAGDRPDGERADGADDGGLDREEPAPGQRSRRDGLDGAHEQPESTGRGNDTARSDLQLNESDQPPQWNQYMHFSPEQRAIYSREYADWEERNNKKPERFAVYELPNRAGVYGIWDNENPNYNGKGGFYEDEHGNIPTFTVETEAHTYLAEMKLGIAEISRGNDTARSDSQLEEDTPPPEQSGGISLPENAEPHAYRYYSIRRPVDIGTYPREAEPVKIVNFDSRTPVEDGAFEAWGYLEYGSPLTDMQIGDYELRAAPGNAPAPETYSQVGNTSEQDAPAAPVKEPDSVSTPEPDAVSQPELDIELLSTTLAGSFLSPDEMDAILRDGGNREKSVLRIAVYYMKDKTHAENTDFLRREYATGRLSQPGGKGFQFGEKQISVWFDETGLTAGLGNTALNARDRLHITWEQAAVRVRELLDAGQYLSRDVLDEALDNEHKELAEQLLYLYRDDFRDFREMPKEWRAEKGGWPDDVARVKELLEDKKGEYSEYSLILERLEEDVAALDTDSDAPDRFWHDPYRILQDMRDAGIPPLRFPADEVSSVGFMPYITEDEIDTYLTRGSNISESKFRILSYFLHDHTPKERADFLKKEYGHGGGNNALSGASNSWYDSEPGKGIILKRGGLSNPYDTVTLKWSAAATRISKLIQDGRYMNRAGLNAIPEYESMILARKITDFYYNLPDEYQRPFPHNYDFHYPTDREKQALREFLDDPARIDAALAAMRPIYENTPPEDRYYDLRQRAYTDLTAWRDGTFTLFPGLDALPDPELAERPRPARPSKPEPPMQMSLFDAIPQANLPGVEEQRAVIEQAILKEEQEQEPPAADIISQYEIDALLLGAVETPEQFDRMIARFTENPRSREAVQLVKDIYSDGVYLMHRTDGDEGYMGLMGDSSGLTITKCDPLTIPKEERRPAISVNLTWPKAHRRVAELIESGKFQEAREQPPVFYSPLRFIPYRVGDAVDVISADGNHDMLIIDSIDEHYVYYTMPDMPEQGPVNIFRSRFEGYLDDGRFTIMEPGARLPERESIEPETSEPERSETPKPEADSFAALLENYRAYEQQYPGAVIALQNGDNYMICGESAIKTRHLLERHVILRSLPDGGYIHYTGLPINRENEYLDEIKASDQPFVIVAVNPEDNALYVKYEFGLEPPEPERDAEPPAQPEQTPRMYGVGDMVYMNGGTAHAISEVGDWISYEPVENRGSGIPILINTSRADFERDLAADPRNRHFTEFLTEPQAAVVSEPSAATPIRSYAVGDTVYLENDKPYVIGNLDYHVRLREADDTRPVPIFRSESFGDFERLLRRNPKNKEYTDFLAADLGELHPDLRDVLENGLLSQEHKDSIAELIGIAGATNDELFNYLSNTFPREAETMTLESGETADFFTTPHDITIEIHNKYNTRYSFSWSDIAPILRSMAVSEWRQANISVEQQAEPTAVVRETPEKEQPPTEHKPTSRDLGGGFVLLQTQRNAYSREEIETAASKIDPALRAALTDGTFFTEKAKHNIADFLAGGTLKHTSPDYLRRLTDYHRANNMITLPDGRNMAYGVDNRGVFVTTDPALVGSDFYLRQWDSLTTLPGVKLFTWEQAFNAVFTLCEYQLDGFTLSEEAMQRLVPEPEQPPEPAPPAPTAMEEPKPLRYAIGDTVYLDYDRQYTVEWIGTHEVNIHDPDKIAAISELMDKAEFEEQLRHNLRNSHLIAQAAPEAGREQQQETVQREQFEHESEYVLDFKYVNERLIVFNVHNADPDEFSPIVARIEPDGGIVILDENLPDRERFEIKRVAETELDRYRAEAEANLQQMLDYAEAVVAADAPVSEITLADDAVREVTHESTPEPPPAAVTDEQKPRYAVGDTVYMEHGHAYVIYDVSDNRVSLRLQNPREGETRPVVQSTSIRNFEEQLRQDSRNAHFFAEQPEPEAQPQDTQAVSAASPASPPPVFFVDWKTAQHDFDLSLYNDRDTIGYDKDGVKHALGRSGGLTYVTSTGAFWGSNTVPGNIYEQAMAYQNGEVTDEQVRENYLKILSDFKARRESPAIAPAVTPDEPEPPAPQVSEVTRDDIDAALRSWNGSLDSKILVYGYMRANARARETAAFLREEYGEYSENGAELSGFTVTKEGAEPVTIPWTMVQRHIARLIEAGHFLTPEEQEDADRGLDTGWDDDERLPDIDATETENRPAAAVEPALPPAANFRITDDNIGAGGPKTRYANNVAAIRTLKQIEAEGRQATLPEQETLSRYVGWGGLSQAFDNGIESWQKEYAELKELLTPDEYDKARSSVLNAHYTPPVVIRAIYDAIGQMGFKRGNLLEPSCATGHFFGCIPEEMRGARLYGVELDSISGRIAGLLYPSANIFNRGFEKTNFPDSFFDVVVGNVPFGDYKVFDQGYNRHNFYIHDYFIAKSIDKARAGGVVALITSNGVSGGTFDKRDSKARRYMAERCDLIGAIRLPDNTFKAAAGTDMTTDILFLQKREVPRDLSTDMPDWVGVSVVHEHEHEYESGETRNNVLTLNNYYREHPEMVLGELKVESGPFGPQLSCKPTEGSLPEQLRDAVSHLHAELTEAKPPELDDVADSTGEAIPADPNVKNFSFTIVDSRVYYRENSLMYPVELPAATLDRIRGMVELRDCVHRLIDLQLDDYGDAAIRLQQAKLNDMYDAFTAEHGLISSVANSRAFSVDSAYYLLSSLEILDEDGNLKRKADMFTKRTIKQKTTVTSVDTASEALAVSIGERARVDMGFMSALSGLSKEQLAEDLRGVIFRLPEPVDEDGEPRYVTADEYLSGKVREKLAQAQRAAELSDIFIPNVEALEKAQPKDLDASDIAVRLGSTWVDKSYIQQFMYELLQTPYSVQRVAKVNYMEYTGEWQVTGKTKIPYNNIAARVTYGTERKNAYEIIEDTLNLRDVRVYDPDTKGGKEVRVLNKKETMLAQQKQEIIKQAFKDWIYKDANRRQTLVRRYNDLFNSVRPREYDGSHIVFSGMNPGYIMRPYQVNAIARVLYGGNTLLAHEVGAGKTFEMVAAAMEGKRLGLCNKSMFAVPNHIIDQIASDFLRLYPSANILVATKKDFEMRNRKKFCAKIATGDYDAVILGHSQLEKIPISYARQERLLQEQLSEILEGIDELKRSHGEKFSIKQLERTKKRLETRLEKMREGKKRDNVVTFEQLGVDRLFVDEAHNYKNLFLYTKMRNVAGLSTADAQKSSDLFLKCRYMDELTDGKGVIFATGTPISNSMTELYTMQRYLQFDNLEQKNLVHFDSWASIFGETVTAMELAPEGTGYRARTRFSKFYNLPELMHMFCETADIKTADTLDLKRPEAHYETVVVQPSEIQQDMVQSLSERAAMVHTGKVDPRVDNMLKITSDGRKIGLDQRLINPLLPDFEGSKVNACMENIHRIWQETVSKRLTQLVFCDFSTPNKDGRFNVYDDIKAKLMLSGVTDADYAELAQKGISKSDLMDMVIHGIPKEETEVYETTGVASDRLEHLWEIQKAADRLVKKGVPEHEIAFIHDANTDVKKRELFARVRSGQVRILFGSTFKMGAGTNVQDRLIAMHDLDCPWRPADLEQRAGRIVRFGNENPEVYIYRYATEGTFDAYLWQTVENKQKFISQIMTSKSPVRSCEDVDETALSYAEIKALCSGNPLIKEKIDLDIEVARLRLLKSEYQNQRYRLEDDLLKYYPENIKLSQERIAGLEKDIQRYNANLPKAPETPLADPAASDAPGEDGKAAKIPVAPPFPPMTVKGVTYTEKEPAAKALLETCKTVTGRDAVKIGSYLGFDMTLSFDTIYNRYQLVLKGDATHIVDLGADTFGNITRINHVLKTDMPSRLASHRTNLENLRSQMKEAEAELQKPFTLEKELAEKEMRLALVNADLNIDGPAPVTEDIGGQQIISAKNARPSILEGLRSYEAGRLNGGPDKAKNKEITV